MRPEIEMGLAFLRNRDCLGREVHTWQERSGYGRLGEEAELGSWRPGRFGSHCGAMDNSDGLS